MTDFRNEINVRLLLLNVSARGRVALVMAVPVSLVLIAIAWRIVAGTW